MLCLWTTSTLFRISTKINVMRFHFKILLRFLGEIGVLQNLRKILFIIYMETYSKYLAQQDIEASNKNIYLYTQSTTS